MNFDISWIMDYCSWLREKEENFNNLCYESSQPTVEYHAYGSQDSNNVETKMNLQACIGKPFPSRCGWNPASSKSSSGGSGNSSSNPVSIHPRTKSNHMEEKRLPKDRIWTDSWMTYVEKILLDTLIFKCAYFDTMIDVPVMKRWQN